MVKKNENNLSQKPLPVKIENKNRDKQKQNERNPAHQCIQSEQRPAMVSS
jgi:hypothetical protein